MSCTNAVAVGGFLCAHRRRRRRVDGGRAATRVDEPAVCVVFVYRPLPFFASLDDYNTYKYWSRSLVCVFRPLSKYCLINAHGCDKNVHYSSSCDSAHPAANVRFFGRIFLFLSYPSSIDFNFDPQLYQSNRIIVCVCVCVYAFAMFKTLFFLEQFLSTSIIFFVRVIVTKKQYYVHNKTIACVDVVYL